MPLKLSASAPRAAEAPARAANPPRNVRLSRYAARFFPWAGKMHCRSAGPDVETGTRLAYQ